MWMLLHRDVSVLVFFTATLGNLQDSKAPSCLISFSSDAWSSLPPQGDPCSSLLPVAVNSGLVPTSLLIIAKLVWKREIMQRGAGNSVRNKYYRCLFCSVLHLFLFERKRAQEFLFLWEQSHQPRGWVNHSHTSREKLSHQQNEVLQALWFQYLLFPFDSLHEVFPGDPVWVNK